MFCEGAHGQSRETTFFDIDVPESLKYASLFLGEVFHRRMVETQGSDGVSFIRVGLESSAIKTPFFSSLFSRPPSPPPRGAERPF